MLLFFCMMREKKTYLSVFLGAVALGVLLYGAKQYFAWRELTRLNETRIDGGWYASPLSYEGSWYLVPPNELYSSGVAEGDIPALTNPAVMTIAEADEVIADDLGGISVEINGEARFYPVQIMNWHEVVHDTLGGESILVYYGPLTGAATVYELPTIFYGTEERPMSFVVSGQEYNNDVLLKEVGTETLWSGIRGTPVVGKGENVLDGSLVRIPSLFMTWSEWKDSHDSGTVLSTNTGYVRDYTRHPYGNYENSPGVYFPVNHSVIPIRAKEPVYLVQLAEGWALMVNTVTLLDQTPSVQVGNECVVAFRYAVASYANIFFCDTERDMLTFTRNGYTFTDAETGSEWNANGVAISGELKGTQLTLAPAIRTYIFAADALFPTATIMGEEFIFEEEEEIDADAVDAAGGTMIEGENTDGVTIEVLPSE
jgi:Protein of unknown function (DUF3179)